MTLRALACSLLGVLGCGVPHKIGTITTDSGILGGQADSGSGISDSGSPSDGGPNNNVCGRSTCDGCCDSSGACIIDTTASKCGIRGGACTICTSNSTCSAGFCSICRGCIDPMTGACQGGLSNSACGRNGQLCSACNSSASESCSGGVCGSGASCNAGNCPGGCCDGSQCRVRLPPGGGTAWSTEHCGNTGTGGEACIACAANEVCDISGVGHCRVPGALGDAGVRGDAGVDAGFTWSGTGMVNRGKNTFRIDVTCPQGGQVGVVWGTDMYTDDSSVCTAGVHAGLITVAAGGPLTYTVRKGLASYVSSVRNGITSSSWGANAGSFCFADAGCPPIEQINVGAVTWTTTPLEKGLVFADEASIMKTLKRPTPGL